MATLSSLATAMGEIINRHKAQRADELMKARTAGIVAGLSYALTLHMDPSNTVQVIRAELVKTRDHQLEILEGRAAPAEAPQAGAPQ